MTRVIGPVLAALGLLAACHSSRNFANDNDVLRARVAELEKQLADEQRRNEELAGELKIAAAAPGSLSEDVRANTPAVAAIEISSLSHAVDSDKDRRPDSLVVYVQPLDGLARFVQIVGRLSINAAVLPGDADAITIGRTELDPAALREAYRSGLAGTHYTVTVPIALPAGREMAVCVVAATFEDGLTGVTHTALRDVALRR